MKIKDLEKTVNIAWSPGPHSPIYLATGTAAQQLDASFSTAASLDVYGLNLGEPGMDLQLVASTPSDNRFYKLVWGAEHLVGGCDGGILQIYSADGFKLVSKQDKHTGAVTALDFNPFQRNLLASAASDSEIFIWDLNNLTTPMTPGAKSQPLEGIQCVAWNRQVQHILATTFSNRCVVWDLRKNEPIIKLTDGAQHVRWKAVCWHPEVATQLCLASEDDQTPVIQLWDLRFATSPLKVLDNHTRGVLAVDWCPADADLLISCGKDNRILCWDPNSSAQKGEVLAELAHTLQWSFDVKWCPRNPAVFAAASFDGHVSVYSLMGGQQQQVQTSNKIADSFPGMEGYVQAPLPQQPPPVSVDLSKAPKWLKRPVGASFGFGGKLISFEPETPRNIRISQVVTEPGLIQAAADLEQAIQMGNYAEYCRQKADASIEQHERYVWHFLKANFEQNPKLEMLNLLGFSPEDVVKKNVQENANDPTSMFDNLKISEGSKRQVPYKIKTGDDTDGLITQAILVGNIETAVDLCIESNRMADALIIAMTGGADLLARTQHRYLQQSTGYVSALISALVSENWSEVINECSVESWKEALAALLTYCSNEELPQLCEKLGERLERESLVEDAQLCYISAGSFNKLVSSWSSNAKALQDPQKLQELVELVTFGQKAIEYQGRNVEISGSLADLLSKYAILLASQGNLINALNCLETSTDEHLNELRDRLYVNLGRKQTQQQQQQQQQQQPNYFARKSSAPRWNPAPAAPPKAFSPVPQPPRPNSASGARNKYIVDPSVQSGYNAMRPQPMAPNLPPQVPQVPQVPQMSQLPQVPLLPVNPAKLPNQAPQMSSVYNTNAVPPPPPVNMPPHQPPPMMQTPPGWNDPPVVTKNIRQQPKTDIVPPTPITHPLFGGSQPETPNGYGDSQFMPQQFNPQQQQQQPPPSVPTMPTQMPPMPTQMTPMPPMTAPMANQRNAPVAPAQEVVQKPPVPEEHTYLQVVFNELHSQCFCAANNPQTKRKLEDVARKLEMLYDMLRGHKLSPQTLNGLHQMVQLVQIGDYTNGLGLHTQLVSGPDFAQIASFMPGLKVLLQCALQLQVYLR